MSLDQLRQYYGLVSERKPATEDASRGEDRDLPVGEVIRSKNGRCFVAHSSFDACEPHGVLPLQTLGNITQVGLQKLTGGLDSHPVEPRSIAFLDTETTGLGMGAGTYVFLVGVGWLDDGAFHVRQFLLQGPQHEVFFLEQLGAFLGEFGSIVTFNGRAFDVPLLDSRFARHRKSSPLKDTLHVDILHPARRMWRRRLQSCGLKDLEESILAVQRSGEDVPGWQIPELYFRYQRSGSASHLHGVFYHNAQDILSLAALTAYMHSVVTNPANGFTRQALDMYSLGLVFERCEDLGQALACYDRALATGLAPAERAEVLLRIGAIYKRQRNWLAALDAWTSAARHGGNSGLTALVEMAKYYEHVERDYAHAVDLALQAQMLTDFRPSARAGTQQDELVHRVRRLTQRAAKQRGAASVAP